MEYTLEKEFFSFLSISQVYFLSSLIAISGNLLIAESLAVDVIDHFAMIEDDSEGTSDSTSFVCWFAFRRANNSDLNGPFPAAMGDKQRERAESMGYSFEVPENPGKSSL